MVIPGLSLRVGTVAGSAAVLVAGAALLVLIGWATGLPALTVIGPGWPQMAPGTAFGLLLLGAGTACTASLAVVPAAATWRRRLPWVCGGTVGAVALLRLGELAGAWTLHVDHWPFPVRPEGFSGGMSLMTSSGLLLLGVGLLAGAGRGRAADIALHATSILACLFGWMGVSRYLYGGDPLFSYGQMAAHAALCLTILGIAQLCARPDASLMRLSLSDTFGGTVMRRVLPAAVLAPVLFGWLRLQGQRAGWYGLEAGLALFTLANIVCFGALLWATAARLRRSELHQREMQGEMAVSEALLARAQAQAHIGTIEVRYSEAPLERAPRVWSQETFRILGYAVGEVLPSFDAFNARIHPEDREVLSRSYTAALSRCDQVHLYECRVLRPDGVVRQVELHSEIAYDAAGRPQRVFCNIQDITERRLAERALERTREANRAIVAGAIDGILTMDRGGMLVGLNPAAEAIFGYRAAEAVGRVPVSELLLGDGYRRIASREPARGSGPLRLEATGRRADGSSVPLELAMAELPGPEEGLIAWYVRDISDRKLADARVQEQLARLGLLGTVTRAIGEHQDLQSIYQVVVRSLEDELPVDFACVGHYDEAAEALMVIRVGTRSGNLALELALGEDAVVPIDRNGLSRCVKGDLVYEPDVTQVDFPFPRRLALGGLRSVVFAPLIVDSRVFGVVVLARRAAESFSSVDCEFIHQLCGHVALASRQAELYSALLAAYEDLRQSQQSALQQERLRSIGQMASGIAHDINNALSPVYIVTETLLEKEPGLSPRARRYLQTIQTAVNDVTQTVARMRDFSRQREDRGAMEVLDINRVVRQVLELTRARWHDMAEQRGAVVTPRVELAGDLPAVLGVGNELRDALTNLVFNAVDAMPTGGTLGLRTRVGGGEGGRRTVRIEVADSGTGMSEETRQRCLEPFYTTKGERGTGLGLAMVYAMAQRHGAELDIASAVGKGTTIALDFPVHEGPAPGSGEAPVPVELPRLRLLVIDDDPLLLKALHDTLSEGGHEVVTANGGQPGIDAFAASLGEGQARFAAVITDLGMPHVDGRKVASAIKGLSASTPVVLLTGWGRRLREDNEIPPHVDRLLNKPPKLRELRQALWELVVRPGQGGGSA